MALCSLSIGSKVEPPSRSAAMNSSPASTSVSLFARRMRLPLFAAASVGSRPVAPTIAAITVSASGKAAIEHSPSGPARTRVARPAARSAAPSSFAACDIEQRGVTRLEAAYQIEQRLPLAVGGQRHHRKTFRMPGNDVERRRADRPGGAEDGDAARGHGRDHPSRWCAINAAGGIAAVSASIRSSTPPWPGSIAPLSLTPR